MRVNLFLTQGEIRNAMQTALALFEGRCVSFRPQIGEVYEAIDYSRNDGGRVLGTFSEDTADEFFTKHFKKAYAALKKCGGVLWN